MRKKLLLTTMLAAAAVWPAASAQTLNATFEADSVTADGWTEVHAAAGKGISQNRGSDGGQNPREN